MTSINKKVMESLLKWFDHVQRRVTNATPRKSVDLSLGTKKKKKQVEVVKRALPIKEVMELALDRIKWRKRIYVANLTNLVEDL